MVKRQEDIQDPATVEKHGHEKVDWSELVSEAREAADNEHQMSLWQAVKLYPKAVGWSILLSTALVMEGYDTALMGSLFGQPAFERKFGVYVPNSDPSKPGSYQLTAAWQAGLSNAPSVGEILGLFANGWLAERFGFRKVMIGALFAVACFIFLNFFAQNIVTLLVGEILLGIPWGMFQTVTTVYAAEVCPVVLRYYLTTYVNLCWASGQLISAGVLRGTLGRVGQWGWRIPFAIQWIWPVPLIIGIFFAPESPWWLIRKNRPEDAAKALRRLTSKYNSDEDIKNTVSMMIHTNSLDLELTKGTTYWDCFRGIDLRRTEIVCVVWICQNLGGYSNYPTYFFEQAGLKSTPSFDLSVGMYAMGWLGTVVSWFLMKFWGRRTLYVGGMTLEVINMLIIGGLGTRKESTGTEYAIGSMLLFEVFVYGCGVGPVCYSLVSEIASNRLRTKQVVLARNIYNIVGIVDSVIIPYMINPTAWNWGAKGCFFWAGMKFLGLFWCFFRLPEPKGRTYAELDILFEKKISARKFASTEVDVYDDYQYDASHPTDFEGITAPTENNTD